MKALILNGSLSGSNGNTRYYLDRVSDLFAEAGFEPRIVNLSETEGSDVMLEVVMADVLVIGTGVYWDQWSSHVQRLVEDLTDLECTEAILGKPVGVVVTMESVGGSGVTHRLQGLLSSMGFLVPPLTGVVFSRLAAMVQEMERLPAGFGSVGDLWSIDDLSVLVGNLVVAHQGSSRYEAWPVSSVLRPHWPKT